jgi:hypothetical protein
MISWEFDGFLYNVNSVKITMSNKFGTGSVFPDWYAIFPDPVIGSAILDRIVSGAIKHVIERARFVRTERISKKQLSKYPKKL